MRILLVNAFHFLKGGVERTYLDESRWLARRGHDVAHLAVRDPRNHPSPTAGYFPRSTDHGVGAPLGRQILNLPQALWSREAARAMERLLADFRPDVVHLHCPSRYLTPSILRPVERAGVPMVETLHGFKPCCTNQILFSRGRPCERCRGGRHWHAVTAGCVQGSRVKSLAGAIEAYLHAALDAYRGVGFHLAPSRFVYEKARELGLPEDSLRLVPHGLEAAGNGAPDAGGRRAPGEPYVLYVGRLSVEKGVALLPEIARGLAGVPVCVVGDGPLRGTLERAARALPNLVLRGRLDDSGVGRLRRGAAAVVVPSLFYEHYCYAAAEALLEERPVVASRIGAIPGLVEHERTGQLVEPGDARAAAAALRRAIEDPAARAWARAGRERVREISNPDRHVDALLAVYAEAVGRGTGRAAPGHAGPGP